MLGKKQLGPWDGVGDPATPLYTVSVGFAMPSTWKWAKSAAEDQTLNVCAVPL